MAGYCGTEQQQRLQRRAEETLERASTVAGYCNGGRVVTIDDINAVGWHAILAELKRDGALGFRMVDASRGSELTQHIEQAGFRIDLYDTFTSGSDPALRVSREVAAHGIPRGVRHVELPPRGDDPLVARVQNFLLAAGVTPFAGSMLVGDMNPARTFVLLDAAGEVAATAHAYRPHNKLSRFRDHAWVGLGAVAPELRGKSLGRYINACAVVAAFEDLGAEVVYEIASDTNHPSQNMIRSCGLSRNPAYRSGVATAGRERFTR